jgi:hypothetical protein
MNGATADLNVSVDGGYLKGGSFVIKKNLSITDTPFDYNSNISGFWNGTGVIEGNFSYLHNNGQQLYVDGNANVTVDGNFTYGDNYNPFGYYRPYAGGLNVLGSSTVATS